MLLGAQGLLDDPATVGPATARRVTRLVERMGFVQVDTINTVERAHHLILAARIGGYAPSHLAAAIERDRLLFEHWTHDASIIPIKWYPHWHYRFERYGTGKWHLKHLGADGQRVLDEVLDRIATEGTLSSSDFEHTRPKPGPAASWWGWKPQKIALDYLWRTGRLHVAGRRNFQKVYDFPERVVPEHAKLPRPDEARHVAWACRTALERLGTATAREIAQFWNAVTMQQVNEWLARATASGEVTNVSIESADRSPPRLGYAVPDVSPRVARLPDAPAGMRLLCPFDPVLRDRARAKRVFDFDFRFEGFVPAARRTHGYYVMAVLEGDRFVGKADPKFDRASGTLAVKRIWWEPNVKLTRRRLLLFEEAVEKLAGWVGAKRIQINSH
jgi:uncharacterized protein